MINHMLKNTFQVLMTRYTYFIGVKKYDTVICLQSSLTFYQLSRLWFGSGFFFGRGYLPELFRQIRTYLPELFRQIRTYLPELFRQIKTYLPEPVPANKNLFAGTPSVGSLNVFPLRDG